MFYYGFVYLLEVRLWDSEYRFILDELIVFYIMILVFFLFCNGR